MPGIDVSAELGQGDWTLADRDGALRNLQRARLDGMVLASRRALSGDLEAGNAELKAALEGQESLYGWVSVNPADLEGSNGELRQHLNARNMLGMRLDARASGHGLYSDAALELCNGYRRYSKPALVIVRNEEDVFGLERLAREVATVKFIAGGAGGDAWQACGHVAKRLVNIMVEPFTSGCHSGKVDALVGLLGAHRVLFGTGYPDQNPGAALGLLGDAAISEGEKQQILKSNATRLFGLGG